MRTLGHLFDLNLAWAARLRAEDPAFFEELAGAQAPDYLWIGCSDSRVPANQIVDLPPGELFVHRNIANIVSHGDMNALSVIQYAVDVLEVKHIIVCGHSGCGGVRAALHDHRHGLIDNWLRPVQDLALAHKEQLDAIEDEERRVDVLCELNVVAQAANVCRTTFIQAAWDRGHHVCVHGWTYDLRDGVLTDLGLTIDGHDDLASRCLAANLRVLERS